MRYLTKTLQQKLVVEVSLGLLLFSLVAGIFTYKYSYKHQLEASLTLKKQLVRTIQSQAEVAVFVNNEEIGQDILNGLLTSPLLKGVRLESTETFKLDKTTDPETDFTKGMAYPLFSPVDGSERIGSLIIVQDDKLISHKAKNGSVNQTLLMLLNLLMAALLIVWVSRRVISRPVEELAKEVVAVRPGDNSRIDVKIIHANDEIGMLSGSINELIDAAESALAESSAARKAAESANRARSEFLDNSGEGFLSFGQNLLVDPEYSRECESIFDHILSDFSVKDCNNRESYKNRVAEGSNGKRGNETKVSMKGRKISDLLFGKDSSVEKEGFEKTIELIFNEELDLKKELYISLLPQVYRTGAKYIKAKYRLIASDTKMMLVLTDITREKELEKDVANERGRLKFVIAAVRETRDFFAILNELKQFKEQTLPSLVSSIMSGTQSINSSYNANSSLNGGINDNIIDKSTLYENLYEIYRHIHTFKGLFAQQDFLSFPGFLHETETKLSKIIGMISVRGLHNSIEPACNRPVNTQSSAAITEPDSTEPVVNKSAHNSAKDETGSTKACSDITKISENFTNDINQFYDEFKNETVLEKDIMIIRQFLGDEFIERKGDVIISSELASKIESMAIALISTMGDNIDHEILDILNQAKRLRDVDIKSLLNPHVEGTIRLAERLGKYVNLFKVEGDDIKVHPDRFKSFTHSLVNVFRNAVDHGIEEAEERVEADKDDYATIECKVKKATMWNCDEKMVSMRPEERAVDNARDYVEITISDDGRGIDLEALRKKVIEKGLMQPDLVETMPETDLLQLIFFDDLSTRESVDSMSGRGMGLSSVKKELERLNGTVKIETEKGRGTRFKFYIPY
ncbi:MAG: HAMP domain-containing protein [Desulfamplus sp.]|nr:HAMP domain-containing protein [Desulfamplus sp.]